MSDEFAIRLTDVSKTYRLYGSQRAQLADVLGFNRWIKRASGGAKEFQALRNITLEIPKGQRMGVVGRNGAGKTTLLKLLCGNFQPTSGTIEVTGAVQALFGMGTGFHPDFTGRENALASLQYNGLGRSEYEKAIADIIEFCELDEFLDQPFKTYSMGMQARLMFATATAIRPEILIVDEVLGAGDAYFIAKSKRRVEKLVNSGCTMLLVSHSTAQVLELCDKAIWLDHGEVRMQGEAFLVIKAYEEFIHGPIARMIFADGGTPIPLRTPLEPMPQIAETQLQEPVFMPHAEKVFLPDIEAPDLNHIAPGGLSRWHGEPGIKITGFSIVNAVGKTARLLSLQPAKFVLTCEMEISGLFACRYGIAIDDLMGRNMTRIWSAIDRFDAIKGDKRTIEILLNPVQIGPGDYTVGISIIGPSPVEQVDHAVRYDLLSRSFSLRIEVPESLASTAGGFYHSAEWKFSPFQDNLNANHE